MRHRRERPRRNDRCPCGSGRKYKRCHGGSDALKTAIVRIDGTARRLLELFSEHRDRFKIENRRPTIELSRSFVASFRSRLEGRTVAEALEAHLREIEARIETIAARRSRFFWMHVARRVPPDPLHDVSPWTTRLYRTVFELALLKHGGSQDAADMRLGESGTLSPREIVYEDLRDVYSIEYLAFAYNQAATAFRRVGKGAALVALGEFDYAAVADEQLEQRMALLDRRVDRYHCLFSPHGSARDTSGWTAIKERGERDDVLILPVLNAEQRDVPAEAALELGMPLERPNYLPALFALRPVADYFAIFTREIEQLIGVSPARLLAFLSALGTREFMLINEQHRNGTQFFQRGYTVTDPAGRDAVLSDLANFYRFTLSERSTTISMDEAACDVRRIVDVLTYSAHDYAAINLWDKAPFKPVVVERGYTIWDHAAIPHFLRALAARVGFLDGPTANHKSEAFEREVNAAIANTAGVGPWRTGVLLSPDGRRRQLDASFIAGEILFVVECKAFSANARVERGDFAALKGRWETLQCYLGQAKTLADFLEAHRIGRNYQVPEGVTRIEHCVCTPLPEYIASSDSAYWFDPRTPRICAPQELLEYAGGAAA